MLNYKTVMQEQKIKPLISSMKWLIKHNMPKHQSKINIQAAKPLGKS